MSLWHATDDENVTGRRVAGSHNLIFAAGGGQSSSVIFPEEVLCVGLVYG